MITNTISDIYNSNKKILWIILGTMVLLVIVSFLYSHFSKPDPSQHENTQRVDRVMDSLQVQIKYWQKTHIQDSLSVVQYITDLHRVELQLSKAPAVIQVINKRTNDQIYTITLLSDDQQLSLFTKWISSTDSL